MPPNGGNPCRLSEKVRFSNLGDGDWKMKGLAIAVGVAHVTS